MMNIDKRTVFSILADRLATILESLTASQQAVQSGAVHPEARQEHPKDTRSIEAGYLARGLAERVETMRDGLRSLQLLRVRDFGDGDFAAPGALVTLTTDEGQVSLYLLAPFGGGEKMVVAGRQILVLTPRSPLGAAISGKRVGDTVVAELPAGTLRGEIDNIV